MEKNYTNFSDFSKDYHYDEEIDKIGEGGFASVYRADDMIRQREVAVKVSKVRKDERYSLKHEFEVVKSFPIHPNIAYYESCNRFKIAGVGLYDLAIMDYYPLGNLEVFIQNQSLTDEQKHQVIEGILSAIDFLHNNDAVHRDIKPSNILIAKFSNKYIPKIADFGLGKIMQVSEGQSSIENSFIGGSINYAAPEQILGTKIRPNVDLWSFGVLLYKVLVGELPFIIDESTTSTSIRRERLIKRIVNAQIPEKINTIAEPYQKIIRKCLVVDADQRVKSAKELLQILNFERDLADAQKLFDNRNIEDALAKYELLLEINPTNEIIKNKISEIRKYQSSSTKIEAVKKLIIVKSYKEALETTKDLTTTELDELKNELNEAKKWINEEEKANLDLKNEKYQAALAAFEQLEQNKPNSFSKTIEECKKIMAGNVQFEQAETLFTQKKFNDAAIIYAKVAHTSPSKSQLFKEHFVFINKFLDLQNEASSLKNQKKWKLASEKFKELLKLTGDVAYEKEIENCEAEQNKTVIIKPTASKEKPKEDDNKTIIIQKNEKPIINEEKTVILTDVKNTIHEEKTQNTKSNLPEPPKKNNNLIYIAAGVLAAILIFYFIFRDDAPLKPTPTTEVAKPATDPKIIADEVAKANAKFLNGEYKDFTDIVINLKEKYGIDSTVIKSQKLAAKLEDLEIDINADEVMTNIAKNLCKQSLRLDQKNKTANRIKNKYNFD